MYGRHGFAGGESVRGAQTKTSKSPISCSNSDIRGSSCDAVTKKFFFWGGGGGGGGAGESWEEAPPPPPRIEP